MPFGFAKLGYKNLTTPIKPWEFWVVENDLKTFDDILSANTTNVSKEKEKKENNEKVVMNDNSVTDDQYFDDFFQDE